MRSNHTSTPQTMEIHHGKHHQTYVSGLNAAVEGNDRPRRTGTSMTSSKIFPPSRKAFEERFATMGEDIPITPSSGKLISPSGGGLPTGELGSAIDSTFGNFDALKEAFTKAALTRFGSGWAWLVKQSDGTLAVTSTPNQDSPLMEGIADVTGTPVIGLDVWEHAYYLNYQNRRPDYVSAFWNVVDWNQASDNFLR